MPQQIIPNVNPWGYNVNMTNDLTTAAGWGPEGFNPDKIRTNIAPDSLKARDGLVQAIQFALDDDNTEPDDREVAARYLVEARDGHGFIAASRQDREVLARLCREYVDYVSQQFVTDDDEEEMLAAGAEVCFFILDPDGTHVGGPLEFA